MYVTFKNELPGRGCWTREYKDRCAQPLTEWSWCILSSCQQHRQSPPDPLTAAHKNINVDVMSFYQLLLVVLGLNFDIGHDHFHAYRSPHKAEVETLLPSTLKILIWKEVPCMLKCYSRVRFHNITSSGFASLHYWILCIIHAHFNQNSTKRKTYQESFSWATVLKMFLKESMNTTQKPFWMIVTFRGQEFSMKLLSQITTGTEEQQPWNYLTSNKYFQNNSLEDY